ncbi:MAG: hypothetical protein GYA15_03725 [Leptolinea sp.]|jgi:hypothetical protein|nr:hypothetical protein [Leptolinea sp.]
MYKTTLTPLRLVNLSIFLSRILLFLIWGYVLLSHVYWFLPPEPTPPLLVWIGEGLHLLLVASYILSFWKEKAGSILMVSSAFIYFFLVVGSGGAISYFLLSILPVLLTLIAGRLKKSPPKKG